MNKTLDNLVLAAAEIVVDHLEEGREQKSTSFSNSLDLLTLAVKARREGTVAKLPSLMDDPDFRANLGGPSPNVKRK